MSPPEQRRAEPPSALARGAAGLLVALLGVITGCLSGPQGSPSAGIPSSSIFAQIAVGASGSGVAEARVDLRLLPGIETPVELTGGDRLRLGVTGVAGAGQTLDRRDLVGGGFWYETGRLPDAAGTEYVVSFERDAQAPAPRSVITMPEPFSLTAPSAGATFSRLGDDIELRWEPAGEGDTMRWTITGDCVETTTDRLPDDPGSARIAAGGLITASGQAGRACDLRIELMRERAGELDPAYGAGGTFGRQVRWVSVRSIP